MCRYIPNRFRNDTWSPDPGTNAIFSDSSILAVHRSLPEYSPTPLIECPALARRLGVHRILIKDESQRFGLRAFKAPGAAYAVFRFIERDRANRGETVPNAPQFYSSAKFLERGEYVFATATDGNHGRGVAWIARKLNQRAVVFMPHHSLNARVEAIEAEGADVIIVNGDYDAAVHAAINASTTNGWHMISDTSWPGYEEIPQWVAAGYTTMFREIEADSVEPDIVFVQSGVGALASAAAWHYAKPGRPKRPRLVSVESEAAACMLESASSRDGEPVRARGNGQTIMAGLNCATPSPVAWPIIRETFAGFLAIEDDHCREAMKCIRTPISDDPTIDTGASGASGLAALLALAFEDSLADARKHLNISSGATVLLLNTEGETGQAHSST